MYASQDDIVELYGIDLLVRVSDLDKDGVPDPDVVQRGLQGADDIINAYLSAQYTIPVVPTPGSIKTAAIDIAVYRMAIGRAMRTDEMRVRYEDALMLLDKISKGQIGLGLPPVDSNGDGIPDNPNIQRKGRSINAVRA